MKTKELTVRIRRHKAAAQRVKPKKKKKEEKKKKKKMFPRRIGEGREGQIRRRWHKRPQPSSHRIVPTNQNQKLVVGAVVVSRRLRGFFEKEENKMESCCCISYFIFHLFYILIGLALMFVSHLVRSFLRSFVRSFDDDGKYDHAGGTNCCAGLCSRQPSALAVAFFFLLLLRLSTITMLIITTHTHGGEANRNQRKSHRAHEN